MISCDELEFGLRDDKIVLISEILPEENGNKCGCICPHCRQPLQARTKGKKRRPHFAHIRNACDTRAARETALHMLAKQILSEKKEILLPGIAYCVEELDIPNLIALRYVNDLPEYVLRPEPHIVHFDQIELEKTIEDVIPDCVIYDGEVPCLVEFAVTHFVDDEKHEKLERLGYAVVEIDLRECYKSRRTREELVNAVLYDPSNRDWVIYPWEEKAKELATQYYIRWFNDFRARHPGIAAKADMEHRRFLEENARYIAKKANTSEDTREEPNQDVEETEDQNLEEEPEQTSETESDNTSVVEPEPVSDPIESFKLSLLKHDFNIPEEIFDSSGNRFLKCTECLEIKLSTEMAYYQYGKGLCKLCSRKLR